MASPASRTVPSSPNPSVQGSPRTRDWSNLRASEPGSAFRGISRGRGNRGGGTRSSRGPPSSSGSKDGSHLDAVKVTSSSSPTTPRKVPSSSTTPKALSEKALNGATERGGRPKQGPRKQSRAAPAVVVAPASPSQSSQTAPPTPSRSAHRRRHQQGKGPNTATKQQPQHNVIKTRNSQALPSQTVLRKVVPPHLVAAHEAEIRHGVDVLVERVRAVAMAENRPTTPSSHIDWAGDEDDSLPDLDDWGVTTNHTNTTRDGDQSEEISPILVDTLKPLPEPNSEIQQEGEEMESYDAELDQVQEPFEPSFLPSSSPTTENAPEQCIVAPTAMGELSSPTFTEARHSLHPSLPSKTPAVTESPRSRGRSVGKPCHPPHKPAVLEAEEGALTTKIEGLSESIHAPSADECLALERVSSASPSERGLTTSIHALVPGLPESHSAPSLLSAYSPSAGPRAHSRSQTEGQPGNHQPISTASRRYGQSGASSPLGKRAYAHSRNHSTPAGGVGPRLPQTSRPVITGEAISRLARTIGGLGPTPRTQTISVTKDSTISS